MLHPRLEHAPSLVAARAVGMLVVQDEVPPRAIHGGAVDRAGERAEPFRGLEHPVRVQLVGEQFGRRDGVLQPAARHLARQRGDLVAEMLLEVLDARPCGTAATPTFRSRPPRGRRTWCWASRRRSRSTRTRRRTGTCVPESAGKKASAPPRTRPSSDVRFQAEGQAENNHSRTAWSTTSAGTRHRPAPSSGTPSAAASRTTPPRARRRPSRRGSTSRP